VLFLLGLPVEISEDDLESITREAEDFMEDEDDREVYGRTERKRKSEDAMSDADLACLRKKFPFLAELSDKFVRSQKTGELLKMETTCMKMKLLEQSRDCEDRLAANKANLEDSEKRVKAGTDNRWNKLHEGRFLGGATCSTKRLWLEARKKIGLAGEKPVGSYDMGALGMGGFITSRGWVEIHNPGSTKLALKMFSINNCAAKASSKNGEKTDGDDIAELGEFKLALRTLRVAMSMVLPWNFSIVALENFMFQSNFCRSDLQNIEQQARILTQFADYVLKENANRWRDESGFLNAGELKGTWDAFFGARPQSQVVHKKKQNNTQQSSSNNKGFTKRKWVDICFDWNTGKCLKAAGTCVSLRGTPLRHVCNWCPDRSKPDVYCEKNHARHTFH